MRIITQAFFIATVSMAAMHAESALGAASSAPVRVETKASPCRVTRSRWMRRIAAAQVEVPLWVSSRGIPKTDLKPMESAESFRWAVQPDTNTPVVVENAPQTLAQIAGN